MNIRSIIGLTAIAPYIIGSSLLISTACAPKSRYRGPVNLAGVAPVQSPLEKAATDEETDSLLKEINTEINSSSEKKAASDLLNASISDIDVQIKEKLAIVLLTTKSETGNETSKFSGAITRGQNSELAILEGNSDISLSSNCTSDDCSKSVLSLKKGNALVAFTVINTSIPAAKIKTQESAGNELSDEDKALLAKLDQVKGAQAVIMINNQDKKETIAVEISQELNDQSKLELKLKGSTEVSESVLKITKNVGLEKLSKAKLVSKTGTLGSDGSSFAVELSSGDENALTASLAFGKDAADIQSAITNETPAATELTKVKPSNGKSNKENSISSLDDIDVNQGTTSIND